MRARRNGSLISNLMFVDDLILFGQANMNQMKVLLEVTKKFSRMPRQGISMDKTSIFFPPRMSTTKFLMLLLSYLVLDLPFL